MRGAGAWRGTAGVHSNSGTPRPPRQPQQPEAPVDLGEYDAGNIEGEDLPPRGWLLGNSLCRQFLTAVLADGGTGKTAWAIAAALSLATSRPLLNEYVFARCNVLFVCFEDGITELRRRIKAAMQHYQIDPEEVGGRLFYAAFNRAELKLGVSSRNGETKRGKLGDVLEAAIERRKADVLILDPLIKTHGVNENDNNALDFIAEILSEIAVRRNLAIALLHHTRKGAAETGNADNGRGASAVKDAARLVFTQTKMTAADAQLCGVPEDERQFYMRKDTAKLNIAPPAKNADWIKLVSVSIGNATSLYPKGDTIQVATPWEPIDLWKIVTVHVANVILDKIQEGPSPGRRYSAHASATDRAAWVVVHEVCPALNETQCREVVNEWLTARDHRFLQNEEYQDAKDGKRKGLVVVGRPG